MTKDKGYQGRMDDIWDDLDRGDTRGMNRRTLPVIADKDFTIPPMGNVRSFSDGPVSKGYDSGKCTYSHPALKLPGTDLVIYGGSCIRPAVKDADIYIGFDSGMLFTDRSYPWNPGHEFLYRITDMRAPSNPAEFLDLINWVKVELAAGKKVHVGCIGGHGRTGTFLAALVATYGELDAVTYVRQHYCQKVVESSEQMEFLHKHFGIKKVAGSKSGGGRSSPHFKDDKNWLDAPIRGPKKMSQAPKADRKITDTINPMANSQANVWGTPPIDPVR